MTKQGVLLVVSGPSGSGKTSLCRALLERAPNLRLSVSATTRPPRPGEVNGRDYFFLSEEDFKRQVEGGRFLEHAHVHGHWYGTRAEDVARMREAGHDVLLEIDWQGARQVAERCPDACRIFILPPSIEALRERLTARGQDSPEVIEARVQAAREEMAHADEARHRIVNDDFDQALETLEGIYRDLTRADASA